MNACRWLSCLVLLIGMLCFSWLFIAASEKKQHSQEADSALVQKPEIADENPGPDVLTHEYCAACHSFRLVEAQRLNRATWEWVMEDMVEKFGAGWITLDEQKIIIDYLVEHYGPE